MNHLECARGDRKKNQWWKYLANIFISFTASNTIGIIPLVVVLLFYAVKNMETIPLTYENVMNLPLQGISLNIFLALMLFTFVIALIVLVFFFKPFHKRTYKQVINGTNKIRWNRFFIGLAVWFIISAIGLGVDLWLNPSNYVFQLDLSTFIPLILITIILIPIQTTYEEITFRGYLAQGVAAYTKNRWWTIIIPGVLFGLLHSFNPEIAEHGFLLMMPQYVFFGLFFGLVAVLDDGIETAMGIHAANNMFVCLFTTNSSSALQTPAVFNVININPVGSGIALVVFSLVALGILYKTNKWDFKVLNKKIEREYEQPEMEITQ